MLYPAIFIILCFLNLKPVCDSEIEHEDLLEVIPAVLSNPYSIAYPNLFPYIKIIWIIALVCAFAGMNRLFCVFGFISMLLIGTFQSMADIPEWDYVWLVSNSVAMYFVGFYFAYEIWIQKNDLSWKNIKKSRLWLLLFFPFLIWYPVKFEDTECLWYFSLHALFFNEAGTAFCYVAPTLLSILIMYYPHVNKSLFGILTFVCSLFGVCSIALFSYKKMIPLVVMHIPLLFTSLYGYYLYFFGNENSEEKQKAE